MRPAIDTANIRRHSHRYLVTRFWVRRIYPYTLFVAAVYVIAAIHTLIFHIEGH